MVFGKNIRVNHGGIAGRSWFAGEDIKAGEVVWWPDEELNEKYTADYDADWVLSTWPEEKQGIAYEVSPGIMNAPRIDLDWETEIPRELMEDFCINHSCNANVWFHPTENKFLARRDIKEGEEVTYDYGTTECNPKWGMNCLCGLSCCRGRITGDDWKNAEFRERFKGHFFGGVQAKITVFEKELAEKAAGAATASPVASSAASQVADTKAGKRKSSSESEEESTEERLEKVKKVAEKKGKTKKVSKGRKGKSAANGKDSKAADKMEIAQ
jgi:hypothetical protein